MARFRNIYTRNAPINSKSDLVLMTIGIIFALWINFPMMFPVWIIILVIALVLIVIAPSPENIYLRQQRINALKTAGIYLSPYENIWKNLKLSNKNCLLRLGNDGVSITAIEKKTFGQTYRKFRIIKTNIHTNQELWDMFCTTFDFQTTYDRLVEQCHVFSVTIYETTIAGYTTKNDYITFKPIEHQNINIEKTDINNASEIEITALPGISIVLSKKIIKKREEIGGFKTIDDVFLFLKLKPHMEKQLRDRICVNKMKGSLQIKRFEERNIDL